MPALFEGSLLKIMAEQNVAIAEPQMAKPGPLLRAPGSALHQNTILQTGLLAEYSIKKYKLLLDTLLQINMEAPRTPLEDLVPFTASAFWELPC